MEYLLKPKNLNTLESHLTGNVLFAFDYDGTLAPLCADPESAYMRGSTEEYLKQLCSFAPVAIITGRSVTDVKKLLPLEPDFVIGNHGAEGLQSPETMEGMRNQIRSWKEKLHPVYHVMDKLGITLEDKEFSLTFHYRNSQNPEVAEGALKLMLSGLPRARVTGGKCVFNVVSDSAAHKGTALETIMSKNAFKRGIYFGDDLTDEDVFRNHSEDLFTVKIGTTPTAADYFLKSQLEMDKILEKLLILMKKNSRGSLRIPG